MLQALLLGCIAFIGKCDLATGTNLIQRPIVIGPLVGLVLGDLKLGVEVGAALELAFLGQYSVGAFIPPNVIVGGVLGTAFAITTGGGAEIAFTMAFPIALLAQAIDNVLFSIVRPMMGNLADKFAAKGNVKAITMIHMGTGFITCTVLFLITFFGFWLGSSQMQAVVDAIPAVVTSGLSIACGILPAMGFAMLARMIMNKKVAPFFFLGFLLSSYFGVPVVGIAFLGVIAALIKIDFTNSNQVTVQGGMDDEDF